MALELLAPLAAAVASVAAGLVVFSMWNYETGSDVLRETRRDVTVEPGTVAEVPVVPEHGTRARLRNVRIESTAASPALDPENVELAVRTGADDDLTVLHWTPLSGLERFGPQRAYHYGHGHEDEPDVFVWEPETDFVDRAVILLRCGSDEGEVPVNVRVAFVEHLTRMQLRRLRRHG